LLTTAPPYRLHEDAITSRSDTLCLREFRIDAGRRKDQKLLHAGLVAAMNGIQRNGQILGRIRAVGVDVADIGRTGARIFASDTPLHPPLGQAQGSKSVGIGVFMETWTCDWAAICRFRPDIGGIGEDAEMLKKRHARPLWII
jgi:hypothetical protein